MTVAAVGVFVAYTDAAQGPGDEVVVAARTLRIGDTIELDDLRTVAVDLPGDIATTAFADPAMLVGRVVLGPLEVDEIVQRGSVTAEPSAGANHEIALTLPRGHIAVGRLKEGERVDVFVTTDDRTTSVVRGAQVVHISEHGGGSLTSARELTLVVAVPSGDAVAAVVHAIRTGDVTVVRSTFAAADTSEPLVFARDDVRADEADPGDVSEADD